MISECPLLVARCNSDLLMIDVFSQYSDTNGVLFYFAATCPLTG